MKTFEFKNILLIKPYVFALIGFFVIGPIIIGLAFLLGGSLPALIGSCTVGFFLMFALFKQLSKTVVIGFDEDHINFSFNGKTTSYLKSQLKGFYSFDYAKEPSSTISMCFEFTDGKKIDLSDYLGTGKYIREKNHMLQEFINTAEEELGFTDIYVSKSRKLGKIGSTWYGKAA